MNERYYSDLMNNQYSWSTKRQADGKFHVIFRKYKIVTGWQKWVVVKERKFTKKKSAIAYCQLACQKAKVKQKPILEKRNERNQEKYRLRQKNQEIALKKREEKKQERLALQPKGKEKAKIEAKAKKEHLIKLIKKTDTKIKSLTTRKKKYLKKLKYYDKRVASMKDVYISKNRNIPKYEDIED